MTNINELTAKLKAAAQKATPGIWEMDQENIWYSKDGYTKHLMYLYQGDDVDDRHDHYNTDYIATANPANILALIEALEAALRANAAQDDHINQQQDRIDQLEEAAKQINSWRRLAKQNIAEREKDIAELTDARQRIAELEARTLTVDHMNAGLRAHALKVEGHSQLSDGFRCGYRWAAAGIKLQIEGE